MRWDAVQDAILAETLADAELAALFPPSAVRLAATAQDFTIPSLALHLITDSGSELWEPSIHQWDIWTEDFDNLITAERRLRKLFDWDVPVVIQGVYMWAEYQDGAELVDEPDRAGFYGRAIRFRFAPIREDLRCGRSP